MSNELEEFSSIKKEITETIKVMEIDSIQKLARIKIGAPLKLKINLKYAF